MRGVAPAPRVGPRRASHSKIGDGDGEGDVHVNVAGARWGLQNKRIGAAAWQGFRSGVIPYTLLARSPPEPGIDQSSDDHSLVVTRIPDGEEGRDVGGEPHLEVEGLAGPDKVEADVAAEGGTHGEE